VFALARSLLLAEAVSHDALAQAMLVSARDGESFIRALLATGAVDAARLSRHLDRADAPTMQQIAPVMSLVESLPAGLCERLLALPVRRDPLTGTVDVAVVDARDPHPVQEIAYWLNAPVRMVHTPLAVMEAALTHLSARLSAKVERGMRSLAPPIWHAAQTAQTAGDLQEPAAEASEPAIAGSDEPVAFIELGPPSIDAPPVLPSLPPLRYSDRPAPPTVRGPFMPELNREEAAGSTVRGPYARPGDLAGAADDEPDPPGAAAIRAAGERDAILESLVAGVRLVARRVGVFALRRDGLVGWTCSPELAERSAFRALRWAPTASTVVRRAFDTGGVSFVAIPADALHAALADLLGPPSPHEVALAAVVVEGKDVAVVLADDLEDALVAAERLQSLSRIAGEALEACMRDRRDRRDSRP
jgi:hypothetical protein